MPYNNTTPGTYKIPYWARGERASGESNLRAARIVENQIRASNQFFGANGVVQEGTYAGIFSAGSSIVTLTANGGVPALEAVIAKKYVNQTTTLQWTGLPDSSTVYLYAQAVENDIYGAAQVSTLQDMVCVAVWNTSGATPSEAILLAKATTTGSAISVDSSSSITDNGDFSDGKPVYYSFDTHRTVVPIDHPNLSVTDVKLANESVLSRAIAPWDGLSSGTDTTEGKGIARGHVKKGAISTDKVDFTTGQDVTIVGNVDVTGFQRLTSGLEAAGALFRSGIDVYGVSTFRETTTFQKPMAAAGFTNSQVFRSGIVVHGDIDGRSGVNAPMGYGGRVAFYRQPLGFVGSPVFVAVDELLLPGFVYPAVITEVLVQSRRAPTGTCTFELRNAAAGAGDSLTAVLQSGERYASGVGVLSAGPSTQVAFRCSALASDVSGLNVFVTGFQQVAFPGMDVV